MQGADPRGASHHGERHEPGGVPWGEWRPEGGRRRFQGMPTPELSKRLTLRATLHAVSPMVIRVLSVSDQLDLPGFHDAFQIVLGWTGEEAAGADEATACLGGRGASPPEYCGGPTGYRLMLKRQREGAALSDPARFGVQPTYGQK